MDIKSVAQLARLEISSEDEAAIGCVIESVAQVERVNIEGIEPTVTPNPVFNVVRDDTPQPGLDRATILATAPQHANHLILVPKVLD